MQTSPITKDLLNDIYISERLLAYGQAYVEALSGLLPSLCSSLLERVKAWHGYLTRTRRAADPLYRVSVKLGVGVGVGAGITFLYFLMSLFSFF